MGVCVYGNAENRTHLIELLSIRIAIDLSIHSVNEMRQLILFWFSYADLLLLLLMLYFSLVLESDDGF